MRCPKQDFAAAYTSARLCRGLFSSLRSLRGPNSLCNFRFSDKMYHASVTHTQRSSIVMYRCSRKASHISQVRIQATSLLTVSTSQVPSPLEIHHSSPRVKNWVLNHWFTPLLISLTQIRSMRPPVSTFVNFCLFELEVANFVIFNFMLAIGPTAFVSKILLLFFPQTRELSTPCTNWKNTKYNKSYFHFTQNIIIH